MTENKRRDLQDLNLLDNFLFGSVVSYPEIGEDFSREMLGTIFGRDFKNLKVTPQKVYYGSNTNLHGTRLDVYIEEDEADLKLDEVGTVYDLEPDLKGGDENIKALPKRVRFYHAKIDAKSLRSGKKYGTLKNVYVIMIVPFDPFGLNRMVYTIKNGCEEVPDMPYEDGARTLFLYTRGTEGDPPEELRQFLRYMESTKEENVVNPQLKKIHQMVEQVKRDEEVELALMKLWEDDDVIREEAREEGREEGRAQGLAEGREEGRKEEMANTERERMRADAAEKEVEALKKMLEQKSNS